MKNMGLIDTSMGADAVIECLRSHLSEAAHLHADSREVMDGDVFVAVTGVKGDGRQYVEHAISRGAAAVVVEVTDPADFDQHALTFKAQDVLFIGVIGLRHLVADLADRWYGQPSAHLNVIAITGTNGKTSCVQWLSAALKKLGFTAGTIGTLGVGFPDGHTEAGHLTTPDVITVHRSLAKLREAGATHVALEASSIGIHQGRLSGVRLSVAGFTNLSHDHLDYHGSMAAYEQAKRALFDWPGLTHAVINIDDAVGRKFAQSLPFKAICYSIHGSFGADIQAESLRLDAAGVAFDLRHEQETVAVNSRILGQHNVSNLLCVAGILSSLGFTANQMASTLSELGPVDGRLQEVQSIQMGGALPVVVVDYAHTPDALERALLSLRPLVQNRGGKLWCVFGCGGNRDTAKRPVMGEIASRLADNVVLTSDNPRDEQPDQIIQQIALGVPVSDSGMHLEVSRAQAILTSIFKAADNDVVLIAGKGHESYQEILGVRTPFDDRQWCQAALLLKQCPVIQTDSRKLANGEVFLALKGENFDGHEYVSRAQHAGAIAAIVAEPVEGADIPQIVLGDTRLALLELGKAWRAQFSIPVIAVTGSNGKTTTKEMIAGILAAWHGSDQRLATQGNLNNDLGVPLTLLRLRAAHRAAVIELGMNHPGEIAVIADATQPTVALVNNAQREHQEFMTTVDAVALENGQVFKSLSESGVAVFPAGDEYSDLWRSLAEAKKLFCFDLVVHSSVYPSGIETDAFGSTFYLHTPMGERTVSLPIPGLHNVCNALAAAACCLAAGAPLDAVSQGLSGFSPVKGRMQAHRLPADAILIDDTYNANPDSVRAAIEVLAAMQPPTMLVLGDMGEVGNHGPAMHREVGEYARQQGINHLVTLGVATRDSAEAFGSAAVICHSTDEAIDAIRRVNPLSVLVKGSRFMRMERIVSHYLELSNGVHREEVKHAV